MHFYFDSVVEVVSMEAVDTILPKALIIPEKLYETWIGTNTLWFPLKSISMRHIPISKMLIPETWKNFDLKPKLPL